MILFCCGTRPEWLKIRPLVKELKKDCKILFTGQHKDLKIDLDCDIIYHDIKQGDNRLNDIVSSLTSQSSYLDGIDYVLVQGDTTSTLAVALSAMHNRKPVIHLEAGLRTYNRTPYPEEFNRRAISLLADVHLCPTETSKKNLIREGVLGKFYVVGNTVLDNLSNIKPQYDNQVLITLHRRENREKMEKWLELLEEKAEKYNNTKFTLVSHPDPFLKSKFKRANFVDVVDPLGHQQFIHQVAKSKLIVSDSGGVQEEASFLKKKVIVCRDSTERVEALGSFCFLANLENFSEVFEEHYKDYIPKGLCPFGDGGSTGKILKIFKQEGIC